MEGFKIRARRQILLHRATEIGSKNVYVKIEDVLVAYNVSEKRTRELLLYEKVLSFEKRRKCFNKIFMVEEGFSKVENIGNKPRFLVIPDHTF